MIFSNVEICMSSRRDCRTDDEGKPGRRPGLKEGFGFVAEEERAPQAGRLKPDHRDQTLGGFDLERDGLAVPVRQRICACF